MPGPLSLTVISMPSAAFFTVDFRPPVGLIPGVLLGVVEEVVEDLAESVVIEARGREIILDVGWSTVEAGIPRGSDWSRSRQRVDRVADVTGLRVGDLRAPLETRQIEHVGDHPPETAGFSGDPRGVDLGLFGFAETLAQHLAVEPQAGQGGLEFVRRGGGESPALTGESIGLEEDHHHRQRRRTEPRRRRGRRSGGNSMMASPAFRPGPLDERVGVGAEPPAGVGDGGREPIRSAA